MHDRDTKSVLSFSIARRSSFYAFFPSYFSMSKHRRQLLSISGRRCSRIGGCDGIDEFCEAAWHDWRDCIVWQAHGCVDRYVWSGLLNYCLCWLRLINQLINQCFGIVSLLSLCLLCPVTPIVYISCSDLGGLQVVSRLSLHRG